jgi:hypothetical protein
LTARLLPVTLVSFGSQAIYENCVTIADMKETPIAERHLVFNEKGKSKRKPLVIRIFAPRAVDPASVSFQVAPGTAVCAVEFNGIPNETLGDTYGADSLQTLQLAADVEPVLKRLSSNYDFYFPTGEGYFDE